MTTPITDLVEDVQWLLECRTWPPEIAVRLGYPTVESLARRLERNGHLNLARPFWPFKGYRAPEPAPRVITRRRPIPPSRRARPAEHPRHLDNRSCETCRDLRRKVAA